MKKKMIFLVLSLFSLSTGIYANETSAPLPSRKVSIVGGGVIGAFESYYAYQDALRNNSEICITVYEKSESFDNAPTNTSYNIVPSLTTDEILSVVPRGNELVKKLAVLFSQPGGIRVDDVAGVNDSAAAQNFIEAVSIYGSDKNHDDRTNTLFMLGKMSMDLWWKMYDQGDAELKGIFESSNFNPCREPKIVSGNVLHDGYRIDLIYGIPNAETRALGMKADYENLGYKNCAILSPAEVAAIDPFLSDFCNDHSEVDATTMQRNWKNDSVALWRPGGCVDMNSFMPKFYNYLKKKMGQYTDASGATQDYFNLEFNKEVTGVVYDGDSADLRIAGLEFSDGSVQFDDPQISDSRYIFCPGEAVGTLYKLGFSEPAYARFAGASLMLNIPASADQLQQYQSFSHCMEVHNEGIVLAWQARVKENCIFIGVAGTKAFYADRLPNLDEDFATNRNLVQLNKINNVLPEFISLAFGYDTTGQELSADDLTALVKQGIVKRWVGTRAVAYDGFPTCGPLYSNNVMVSNARCTTHLGSGGVSFGPAAVVASRSSENETNSAFLEKVLMYADSRRVAEVN